MDDLTRMRAELDAGDATAVIAYAGVLSDMDHPNAGEIAEMASNAVGEEDMSVVSMSLANLFLLVDQYSYNARTGRWDKA